MFRRPVGAGNDACARGTDCSDCGPIEGDGTADGSGWTQVASCDDCGDCGTQTILDTGALPAGDYLLLIEVMQCNVT